MECKQAMTDKELKKLNRKQLLELLLAQARENAALKTEIARLEEKLHSREVQVSQAGNLAEAALQLNGVFEAAQAAASQYLLNVKLMAGVSREVAERQEPLGEDA